MDYKKEIAALLRFQRNRAKMTQEQLAEKSGLSINTIKHAETGRKIPHLETYFKLAEALEISPLHYVVPLHMLYTMECTSAVEAAENFLEIYENQS